MDHDLILSPDEIERLTGYRQAHRQLAELHRLGYWRARRNRLGAVIVERAHHDAVCTGAEAKPAGQPRRPSLRLAAA